MVCKLDKKIDQLAGMLDRLSFFLTDKEYEGYQSPFSFDDFWWGTEYYLADGGYSRICYSASSGKLFLTDNSIKKPKERWDSPGSKKLREKVEEQVKKIYEEMERQEALMNLKTTGLHKD
tara:strand:- start:10961 stop:11320 length:360 start_codon:yes stop_codon:yes gene_type:complete